MSRLRRLAGDSGVRLVVAVVAYVAVALAALAVVVLSALDDDQRTAIVDVLGSELPTLVLGGVIALTGLTVLLLRGPGAYPRAARRMTGDVEVLLTANPDHRVALSGPPELDALAAAVNELADRRAAAEGESAESERDLLDGEEVVVGPDALLSRLSYTVLDLETTGFHADAGDAVVAVGAVHVVGGRLRPHEVFEQLVDPRRRIPETATAVHGITDEMVRGQPTLDQVLPQLARFAEGRVLVGHNVAFDLGFLRPYEERTGVRLDAPVLDTLLLSAALHPDHEKHSLEAVAERLGVDVTGRHTALGDALVTGEVLVRQLALLDSRGVRTLGEALDLSRATLDGWKGERRDR